MSGLCGIALKVKTEVEVNHYDINVDVNSSDMIYDQIIQYEDADLKHSPIKGDSIGNVPAEIDEDLISVRDSEEGDMAVTVANATDDKVFRLGLVSKPFV